MLKFINIKVFLIFLVIGFLVNYFISYKKKIIYKFPNPDNLDYIYNTDNNECYKFKKKQVDCDENSFDNPIVTN